MYRSRPMLVLLKERQRLLTAQRQVARCIPWQCQSLPQRKFSDSVKVLTKHTEKEEEESVKSKKTPKQKLFSIDDVLTDTENDVKNHSKTESPESTVPLRKTEELSEERIEEKVIDKSTTLNDRENDLDIVNLRTSEVNVTEEITKADVKLEEVEEKEETGNRNKKPVSFTNARVRSHINLINTLKSPSRVLNILNSCFSEDLSMYNKNLVISCALKRLKFLNVLDLGEDIETKLQDHLDNKSQVSRMSVTDLLNILDYFIKENPEDNPIAYTILHELCWRLRKSSVSQTLEMIGVVKHRRSTDKRKEAYTLGKKRLIENIEDVSSPQELLSVMYLIDGKDEAWPRIEEEALIMLRSMDTMQTYRLIYLLAISRSKNTLLVNKARKQLSSRPVHFDVVKLKNLFFACDVLRINDPTLLQEMSVNMIELLESDSSSKNKNISLPILLSCSRIGWNHRNLIDLIMEDVCKIYEFDENKNKVTDVQHASVIMSLGNLNLVQYGDFGLKKAEVLKSRKQLKPTNWLNVEHSLACLQKCDRRSVIEVLSREFYSSLQDCIKDHPAYLKDIVQKKMLSLYGYFKEDLHETNADIENLASEWRNQLQEKLKSAPLVGLAKVVSEVLMEISPLEKYTNRNVVTKYGYVIDFEIFVDKKLKAVRLDSTDGMQKVWIKILDYGSFLHSETEPEHTGSTAMMLRHLKSEQDAAIVYVPYIEWSRHDKKIGHLLYLESKIKAAVYPETQVSSEEPV